MENIWSEEEEAARLHARFDKISQAKFARDHKVPGGASMVSQHIKGRRPINLDAAKAYARGFKCSLEEISPRLAKEVKQASTLTQQDTPNLIDSFQDWRLQASTRSIQVIDQLTLLAKKNKLKEEDWQLIEQLVQRFSQK